MTPEEQLVAAATTFCGHRGISKARLATIVINYGGFFKNLEAGGTCTVKTYQRFRDYFAEHGFSFEELVAEKAVAVEPPS